MRAISLLFAAAVASAQDTYQLTGWASSSGTSNCGTFSNYDQVVVSVSASLDQCVGATSIGNGFSVSFMLKRLTSSSIGLYVYGGSTCSTSNYPIGDVFDPSGTTDTLCESASFCVPAVGACYQVSWKISKIINISSSIGIIIGASVGGLLLCCGIGFCVFFFIVRPRRNKTVIITSGMGMSPVVNPAGGFPQQQMMMPQQQQQQQQQGFPYPMHPQQQQQMMMPQQQQMMMPQQQQQMPMSPQMMPMSQQQQPPQTPV